VVGERGRGPVTNDGPHYPLPYAGEGAVGLGKPQKSIVHPLRSDLPIWLGAEGPKNVALTAEIADGWIPIFYSPASAGMYQPWLDEGFARLGARRTREEFEIASTWSGRSPGVTTLLLSLGSAAEVRSVAGLLA